MMGLFNAEGERLGHLDICLELLIRNIDFIAEKIIQD
jgi:hypothetical protein